MPRLLPRRLVAASLSTLVAVGGVAGVPATRAWGGSPTCVGLVVDATTLGHGVTVGCEQVGSHATGTEVLAAAHIAVGYRSDGLICTLDRLPSSGCSGVDDSHYWAYFHRAPGSSHWVYSDEGATTYQPEPGSVEGWVYDDGSSRTPDDVPAGRIFPAAPTPPRHSSSPHPSEHPTPAPSASRHSAPPHRSSPKASSSPTTGPGTHATSRSTPRSGGSASAMPTRTYSAAPLASATPSSSPLAAAPSGDGGSASGSGNAALDIGVVAGALALLAGALLYRRLRS